MKPSVAGDFTSITGRVAGRNSARTRPGPQLRKLLDAQESAWNAAMNTDVDPKYRAGLMRAYHDLTRLVMDWQGIGKPKPVTAKNDAQHSKAKLPSSVEPIG